MPQVDDRMQRTVAKEFPWGPIFAKRANFESGYLSEERRLVTKYLQSESNALVLGSGNGREARPICRDGHRIVCLDIGFLYLLYGQKLFAAEGVSDIAFLQADVANLPFRPDCFDFVFFSFYSSLQEGRFDVMIRIWQILKADGLVLLTACTPLYQDKYRGSVLQTDDWAFVASAEQLRAEISRCGFELLESAVDPIRPEYRCAMLRKESQISKPPGFGPQR